MKTLLIAVLLAGVDALVGPRHPLRQTYYAMVDKAYGHRLHPKTLEKLVNLKWMQTDHLNSKLCDDPANFFLLFAPVNNFFSFEKLFHYKKEWSGDAYRAVVRFEHAAVELQYPSRFA